MTALGVTKDLFNKHTDEDGCLKEVSLLAALRELGIHPSRLQVREMIQSSQDIFETSGVPYEAFCVFVQEFKQGMESHPQLPCSVTKKSCESYYYNAKNQETVFLGGSCNPTTWRHDQAIPFFEDKKIPFYNPQVSDWKQELVEIENAAKKDAELLFFVIDINQTRSASSMIEAAFLAGCDRQLILVMSHFKGPDLEVRGEKITESEFVELRRSQEVVVKNVEGMRIPVFRDIAPGLECAAKVIKESLRVQDLTIDDGARPLTSPDLMIACSLLKYKEIFDSLDKENSGTLQLREVESGYRSAKGCDLNNDKVSEIFSEDTGTFTFSQFCLLCSQSCNKKQGTFQKLSNAVYKLSRMLTGLFQGPSASLRNCPHKQVYLGGCRYDNSTWREDMAIPILKDSGVSYGCPPIFNPESGVNVINADRVLRENCSLLLYVVNADTRGLATMCQIAFFIGLGCRMVLCMKYMEEGTQIEGEQLSKGAVNDYNRGRVYLSDLAIREGIPIFEDLREAVMCVVKLVKEQESGR